MATGDTRSDRRPARWNVCSVGMPFVGLICGVVVGLGGRDIIWEGHPMDGAFWGFRVWFGFCVLGLLAALIALVRAERLWGVTALGIILNLPSLGLSSLYLGGR